MKRTVFLLLSMFLYYNLQAQSSGSENSIETSEKLVTPEMIDMHMVSLMNQYNISGLSAAIVKGGETVWKRSYGYSNRETLSEVNNLTSFLLYSVTKTFTGIGLMQLYENAYFDLDDPVNDYLPFELIHPDYPSDAITIRMLMNHTSGIKDNFTVINSLYTYNVDTDIALASALENYLVEGGEYYGDNTSFTNNRPGTSFSYSNVGAALGGYLIECLSGIEYEKYVTDSILSPAGMTNSFFRISDCDMANIAMEYTYSSPNYNPVGIKSNPFIPAGFLRSDINDMSNYLKMLLQGGIFNDNIIINEETLNLMMTEDNPEIAPNSGLFFGYDSDNDLWGHNGGTTSVKTGLFIDRDDDWGVVVLTNGAGEPWQILFMLYQYAKDFEVFNATNITVADGNDDFILESEENVELSVIVRNNSDFNYNNISVELTCNNSLINFTDYSDYIVALASGQTLAIPLDFSFNSEPFSESFESVFVLHFFSNDLLIDTATFKLYFGEADVLLVNDEEHVYRNRSMSAAYYKQSILAAGKSVREYDLNLFGIPSTENLFEFESVMWFTGLDNEAVHNVMQDNEQILISEYLNEGGNLFLSSQNVSDAVGGTSFFQNYLKAEQTNPDYTGTLRISGLDTVEISSFLDFYITGGDGSNTQYSPSAIAPVNGSNLLFKYFASSNGAGIYYDGNYKLVYLPFCFSSIDNLDDRNSLMSRIMAFFDGFSISGNSLEVQKILIYPNPVVGNELYITTNKSGVYELAICDLYGRIVYSESNASIPSVIKISSLPIGNYLIFLSNKDNTYTPELLIISD